MAEPSSSPDRPRAARGLRLLDLVGFVAGYGLASLLVRTVRSRALELTGPPVVALALEFAWLGLAMSGPIILGLDQRRSSPKPAKRPQRPGRLISEVVIVARQPPGPAKFDDDDRIDYSRAELAWMAIGGYWIALTFLVVPARTTDAPWTLAGLVPVIAILLMIVFIPRRRTRSASLPPLGWTHTVAVGLLWTWPIAWGLLFLLGRTL